MPSLKDDLAEFEGTPELDFDRLSLQLGEAVWARMEDLGINRTELARRMGVSRARVTQVLSGSDNLTLKTLVAVANALDTRLAVNLESRTAPDEAATRDSATV